MAVLSSTRSKWLLIGFIISICFNLFMLAGIVAGRVHGFLGRPEGRGGMVMATVPTELKPIIREKLKARGSEFRQEREKMRELRAQVANALAAEPFDPVILDTALSNLEQSAGKMLHHAQDGLAKIAAELTPAQRQQWADGWRKLGERR